MAQAHNTPASWPARHRTWISLCRSAASMLPAVFMCSVSCTGVAAEGSTGS